MATLLNFGRDVQGYNAFAMPFSDKKYSATLTTGVAATITVSADSPKWLVFFLVQDGKKVWVSNNNTAAVPAGATFASTNSELINSNVTNTGRIVSANDVLSFITDDATAEVSVIFYTINYP